MKVYKIKQTERINLDHRDLVISYYHHCHSKKDRNEVVFTKIYETIIRTTRVYFSKKNL